MYELTDCYCDELLENLRCPGQSCVLASEIASLGVLDEHRKSYESNPLDDVETGHFAVVLL